MNMIEFTKGMAAGMILGAGITMAFDPVSDKQRKRLKRKTCGMARRISYAFDDAVDKM